MRIKAALALTALSVLCAIAPAEAATFVYQDSVGKQTPKINVNNRAGKYTNITAEFDTDTNILDWSSTFTRNSAGRLADGAWLVLSDGENPKQNVNEYAILYLDSIANKVSIYNYDGKNGPSSYLANDYLGSTALNVVENGNDEVTFEFSLDATAINSQTGKYGSEWDGIAFGKEIGIWFHGVTDLETTYDSSHKLLAFDYDRRGYYDTKMAVDTKKVPEPGSLAALGIFGAVAATKLRKRIG